MASMKSLSILDLFSLFLLSPFLSSRANASLNENLSFEAIYQFGDSLSDTGNNLILDGPFVVNNPCGRFPYGISSGNSTGRCSDGQLMVDFIANFFHMPHLSPYLNKESDSTHGLNFAVAGSTALDTNRLADMGIFPVTNKSLSVQINWFKSHLKSFCGDDAPECKRRVRNSLIMMGEIGGNEYNYALIERKSIRQLENMVPEVVDQIKRAVEEVINLGAIRIVVPGNFPIGCIPKYLTMFESTDPNQYDSLKCLTGLNNFSVFHNKHLQFAINELQAEYPNVAIVYGDYYNGLRWILESASSLGFKEDDLLKACCGDGNNKYNFNPNKFCGSEGVQVCENPEERYSWDGIHLTQHAYLHMSQYLLKRIVPGILQVV